MSFFEQTETCVCAFWKSASECTSLPSELARHDGNEAGRPSTVLAMAAKILICRSLDVQGWSRAARSGPPSGPARHSSGPEWPGLQQRPGQIRSAFPFAGPIFRSGPAALARPVRAVASCLGPSPPPRLSSRALQGALWVRAPRLFRSRNAGERGPARMRASPAGGRGPGRRRPTRSFMQ